MTRFTKGILLVTGVGAACVAGFLATRWHDVETQYELYRLRHEPGYFQDVLVNADAAVDSPAIRLFISSAFGAQSLGLEIVKGCAAGKGPSWSYRNDVGEYSVTKVRKGAIAMGLGHHSIKDPESSSTSLIWVNFWWDDWHLSREYIQYSPYTKPIVHFLDSTVFNIVEFVSSEYPTLRFKLVPWDEGIKLYKPDKDSLLSIHGNYKYVCLILRVPG